MHRDGTFRGHRVRHRTWLLAVLAAACCAAALADSTPQQALKYVDPSVADAKARLALQQQTLDVVHQMDATVTATPGINYTDITNATYPPYWSTNLGFTANVGYSYDRQGILNDLYNIERAKDDIRNNLRRGIFQALDTQARMLQDQVYVKQMEAQVASYTNAVSNLEAQVKAGKAKALDLAKSKLQLQNLQLSLDQSKQQLQAIQDQGAKYGLDQPADYASLRFVLPKGDVKQTGTYMLRELNVQRNQATLVQDDVFNTLQYVQLSGTYASGNVALQTNIGIINEKPRAEVNFIFPGGTSRWSVGVSATISLSSSNLQQTPILQQNIKQAQHDLASYVRDFKTEAERRLNNAKLTGRRLTLDEQQLALSKQQLDSVQHDVDTLRQALQNASQKDKSTLQRQMQGALRDLQRAQSNQINSERNLYSMWSYYVRNVFSYLDYIDAPWKVASK